jgi:HD superfamily phosphohydrolase
VPPKALLRPGGKTALAGLKIRNGTKLRPISEMSSIARALQGRRMFDWAMFASCSRQNVEAVSKKAWRVLLG